MHETPFADLPVTPANHFKLYFYAALSQMLLAAADCIAADDPARHALHALDVYGLELDECGAGAVAAHEMPAWWREAIHAWESSASDFLPVRAVRDAAGLDHDTMAILFGAGLVEEDARFASLFEVLNEPRGQSRPTTGLLTECFAGASDRAQVRDAIRRLHDLGLLHVMNPEAPRLQQALEVPGPIWDVFRGAAVPERPAPWARYRPPSGLAPIGELILPETLLAAVARLPVLLRAGDVRAIIVRGPQRNGRRTLAGALARALGFGMLEVDDFRNPNDERWRQVGLLATALGAMPVVICALGPGETADIPRAGGYDGPLGLVIGRSGGVSGASVDRALTLELGMPDSQLRREHWRRRVDSIPDEELDRISDGFRMTAGHLRRASSLARSYAALSGRPAITAGDVQQASRALNRQALETLAEHVPASGDWRQLAAPEDTVHELTNLELRCRHRERLAASFDTAGLPSNCGVRALFRGPSGTGKTLAARLLAAVLQKDLYRLDLSAVINKYIGETEKNLDRVLSRAEELDVMLLVDEGDSLLTQRTNVQSSNDRYANLETNYLLQRLECFDGIMVVTTNAGDRIDAAFERRMDVVVEFRQPQPSERWEIWQLHLPAPNAVDPDYLNEVATRCVLGGGQIRNAVLQASLLALDARGTIDTAMLDAAVRREYRKLGAVCPLRQPACSLSAQ